jgi:hypothetical protein
VAAAKATASFEENRGQHDPRIRFMARGANFTVYLTAAETVYVLPISDAAPAEDRSKFALRMAMAGAHTDAPLSGEAPQARRVNYLRGNDPDRWVTDAPTFGRVRQRDVYDGVDLVWYANDAGTLEYDFEVDPARDPRAIEIAVDGASWVEVADDGDLWMHTDAGVLKQARPIAYQDRDGARVEISSAYEMRGAGRIGFRLGEYDGSRALVIDPNLSQLAFSSYLGGNGTEQLTGMAVDGAGNVYVTGSTDSINFPTVSGSFDVSANGGTPDVFVTKLNAAATTALYSTYLGGSGSDREGKIAVDSAGRAHVVGFTNSPDFPTTAGAFDPTYNSPGTTFENGFVVQLTPSGAALGYGTYLGGDSSAVRDVAVDTAGNAYVVGMTHSTFPVTTGAFDTTFNGGLYDYFVAKLNPTGSSLVYSTFLGGSDDEDWEVAIALAGSSVIVAGGSESSNFPTTSGAFDTTYNGAFGEDDAVVVILNSSGTALIGSTFLGGGDHDRARDVAFGTDAFVYVAGMTLSINFPTTGGAFDQTHNGGADGFVSRLNLNMSALSYSTFVGGSQSDGFQALALEPKQCVPGFPCAPRHRVFAVGTTTSTNVPLTTNAFDSSLTGPSYNSDGYVALVSLTGSAVDYATYFGGSGLELPLAAASDPAGNVFIAGMVRLGGTGFPIAGDSVFQKAPGGGTWDGFVAKLGNYVVSGRVLNASGVAMPGVTVTASQGFSGTTQTDAQGFYLFQTPSTGNYRITPSQPSMVFTPLFREFVNPQSNRVANFTGQ